MTLFHKWLIATLVCVLAIFQVGSYHADKANINWLYIVIAILAGGVSAYLGYKGFTNKE